MSGILKGKDIQDGSIAFKKLDGRYVSGSLAENGDGLELSFDGITGHIYHRDDTFLYIEFTAETELTNVDINLIGFGSTTTAVQSLHGRTLNNTTPVTFNALTIGAQRRVIIDIFVNGTTYTITGGGNSKASAPSGNTDVDLQRCWGYVQKFN